MPSATATLPHGAIHLSQCLSRPLSRATSTQYHPSRPLSLIHTPIITTMNPITANPSRSRSVMSLFLPWA
jgi:hypothetical protein